MNLKGDNLLLRIKRNSTYQPFHKNTTVSLTIDQEFIQHYLHVDSNSPRTTTHTAKRRSWSIDCTVFMDADNYPSLFATFRTRLPLSVRFDIPYGIRTLQLTGDIYISSLTFHAQGHGLLKVQFSALGNGAPTITSVLTEQ